MYLLFYLHLTESLYQLTTKNKVLTITTLHQSSDNPATTRRSSGPNINETKRTLKRGFTSSKVRLGGLRPEPFQLHWPHCLPGLRERVSA